MTSTHPPIGHRAGFFTRKTLVRSLPIFVVIAIINLSIAAGLIYWPRSAPFPTVGHATTAEDLRSEDISVADTRDSLQFTARDGSVLVAKRHGPATDKVILLLHGVASNQSHMLLPAEMLSEASDLEVITLDLRGHGLSDGPRNDVTFIISSPTPSISARSNIKRMSMRGCMPRSSIKTYGAGCRRS